MSLKQTSKCLGFQQIAVLTASTGLTVPDGAQWCLMQTEAQTVRWRDDGAAPTAAIGMQLLVSGQPTLYDGDLKAIRFIEAAASAKLNVSYYQ